MKLFFKTKTKIFTLISLLFLVIVVTSQLTFNGSNSLVAKSVCITVTQENIECESCNKKLNNSNSIFQSLENNTISYYNINEGCEEDYKCNEGFNCEESYSTINNVLNNTYTNYAPTSHKVLPGDTMWKIAVRYEIGLAELIKANPQIKNPALIYVGQVINIPEGAPLKTLEDEVVRLVNIQRVNAGLQPLAYNWQAARVARIKSQDMITNKYFSHISPVYGSPFVMLESYGLRFSAAAENIAKGQRTAQEVMNSWMNSPGHKANILSRSFTEIGVGAAKDANGTHHWTQMFLKPV